ncbi:MAG TPA: hypothetical protein VKV40_06565 [Ktedonobacteraceae bacterium]|nr:hypothetical protein [Ktedonobacteraceae bacterium]
MQTTITTEIGKVPENDHSNRSLPSEDYVSPALPHVLGTFDMTTAFIMAVFWISNVTTIVTGGAAGLTYNLYLLGTVTLALLPSPSR